MASYPAAKRTGQTETLEYAERERLYDRGLDRARMNSLMERLQARLGSKNKLGEAVFQRKNTAGRVKQLTDGSIRYTDTVIDRILEIARTHDVPPTVADTETAPTPPTDQVPAAEPDVEQASAVAAAPVVEPTTGKIAAGMEAPVDANVADPSIPDTTVTGMTVTAESAADAGSGPAESGIPASAAMEAIGEEPRVDAASAPRKEEGQGKHRPDADASDDWLSGVRERREQIVHRVADHDGAIASYRAEVFRIEEEIARIAALRDGDAAAIGKIDEVLSILRSI